MAVLRTKKEKEKIVEDIEALVKEGLSIVEASKRLGRNRNYYYSALKSLGKEPFLRGPYTGPKEASVPVLHRAVLHEIFSQQRGETDIANESRQKASPEEPPMVILIGRESSVNQALANLGALWR